MGRQLRVGIGAVIPALKSIGEGMSADYIRMAASWLLARQNDNGGWGESCASYMDDAARAHGVSTPSQTAWALVARLCVRGEESWPAIAKVGRYLCDTQSAVGTWEESVHTATGFPGYGVGARLNLADPSLRERLQQGPELSRGFMINFNMYRHYFPTIALARLRRFLTPAEPR